MSTNIRYLFKEVYKESECFFLNIHSKLWKEDEFKGDQLSRNLNSGNLSAYKVKL